MWIIPMGDSGLARARKIGYVIEWSPPAASGSAPASTMRRVKASMSAVAAALSNTREKRTSPMSATRARSKGFTPVAWLMARISDDWLRISRGPWRAPGRLVTPPSKGTPNMAMSRSLGSGTYGARMKVAISE